MTVTTSETVTNLRTPPCRAAVARLVTTGDRRVIGRTELARQVGEQRVELAVGAGGVRAVEPFLELGRG